MRNKRGISETVIYVVIAILALVITVLLIFFLKGTGFSLVDKIKSIISGTGTG